MKLKIGKTQGILEKNSILLNKVKEFSLKLKDFDKNSTKFLKKLKLFPKKLKVLPSRLGFYCWKRPKKACLNTSIANIKLNKMDHTMWAWKNVP